MRLLVVGNLEGHMVTAAKVAIHHQAQVTHVSEIEMALQTLRSGQGIQLVLIDVALDVAEFMKRIREEHITIPVIACGVNLSPDAAVKAIQSGALEFIPLPPDPEMIGAILKEIVKEDHAVIFGDPNFQKVLRMAEQVAGSDASILITGESGTGKEVMSRFIHNISKRSDKAFVSVNCAAIPENLLESELFGHEKGAFTGAIARRIGKFEEANGGTLLLDEISEMSTALQAKLLRAIQEREIDRLGGREKVKVNIRLIATSNQNLKEAVAQGRFREDLYYRLNVINLHIPPLRQRPQDIQKLAQHFVKKYCELNHIPLRYFGCDALKLIQTYSWPGNVRELENTIHRAVLLAPHEEVRAEDLQIQTTDSTESGLLVGKTVAEVEKDLIIKTLNHCEGNRTLAANILGISIRTLRNKLNEYSSKMSGDNASFSAYGEAL